MNNIVNALINHVTIRKFDKEYNLPKETLDNIIKASKQAPSWMNAQAYSIMVFEGKEKDKLADILRNTKTNAGNANIIDNSSVFLLYSISFDSYLTEINFSDEIEPTIIGSVDVGLALQNALVATESYGLGCCIIGGIRKDMDLITKNFSFLKYTMPIVGIAIGKPTEKSIPKPRIGNSVNVINAKDVNFRISEEDVLEYEKKVADHAAKIGYPSVPWLKRAREFYENNNYSRLTKSIMKEKGLF